MGGGRYPRSCRPRQQHVLLGEMERLEPNVQQLGARGTLDKLFTCLGAIPSADFFVAIVHFLSSMHAASREMTGFSRNKTTDVINWSNLNYPPLLKVVHYDVNELHEDVQPTVRLINLIWLLHCAVMLLNLVDNALIAFFLPSTWLRALYSALNVCIFPTASMFVFYTGYKSIARAEDSRMKKFMVFQGLLVSLSPFPHAERL